MKAFQKHGAEIAAVCDVYAPNLAKGKERRRPGGGEVAAHTDFRRVLDDKTIDVVINATPDHWHALPMVMACQAGKDVFVEKPVAVSVEEGKAMLAAARKHQRVVQVASGSAPTSTSSRRRRSSAQGLLGKVTFVRTWNYWQRVPERHRQPAGLGAARRPRLGHVARPGAEGPVQREPLRRARRPLVHLPLLLGLLERHAGRLGRAPHRHRAVGPRGARARR